MTELTTHVARTTNAKYRDKNIVVTLAPPAYIALRLQGSPVSYLLDAEVAYTLAIRQYAAEIDRRARRLAKEKAITLGKARKHVEKEMRKEMAMIARKPKQPQKAFWIKCLLCGLIFKGPKWPITQAQMEEALANAECSECGPHFTGRKFKRTQKFLAAARQKDGILQEPIV